ncbi:HEPN domain-containing protein [Oscillatoria amoena NRMC-F 0135]|nr:HEPN domain-containing protein [Oscillatoria amoena NRMC-F 0135]
MGRDEQIKYWINSAEEDWLVAEDLIKLKRFLHALFLFHLVLEKLLKANWIHDNFGDTPPFTHNLEHIYSKTNVELSASHIDFLRSLNAWNIEGRYPDYQNKVQKIATEEYTLSKYEIVKTIRQCLLERLLRK